MTNKQKIAVLIVFGGIACLVIGSMLFSMINKKEKNDEQQEVSLEIPDAMPENIESNKREGYRRNDIRNVDRYWEDSVSDNDEIDEILSGDQSIEQNRSTKKSITSEHSIDELTEEDLLGIAPKKRTTTNSVSRSNSSSTSRTSTSGQRITKEERLAGHMKRRQDAIDSAMGIRTNDSSKVSKDETQGAPSIGRKVSVKRTGVVSSLESTTSDISSLDEYDDTITTDEEYPFQCMFVREAKLKSGSRVAVRLLEDMLVDGLLVPKNTHLMAQCSIGDRVRLSIANIEINGRIYQFNYEAYDNDGGLGIYCPDLKVKETKQIKSSGLNIFNSMIGGRVGNVARDITNTGVAIANSIGDDPSVIVPAGYTFFIVKKSKQ